MNFIDWSFEGGSRIVLCVGPLTFKFARMCEYWRGRTWYFSGVYGNNHERRRSKKYGSKLPLAPTYLTLGLLNVQRRGKPITQEQLENEKPWGHIDPDESQQFDLCRASSYCRIAGKIVMCDYGRGNLEDFLNKRSQPVNIENGDFEMTRTLKNNDEPFGFSVQEWNERHLIRRLEHLDMRDTDAVLEWLYWFVQSSLYKPGSLLFFGFELRGYAVADVGELDPENAQSVARHIVHAALKRLQDDVEVNVPEILHAIDEWQWKFGRK